MLSYFSCIDYYCNDRFSTSIFLALKMATQTKLEKYFGKGTLLTTNKHKQKSQVFSNLQRKKKITMKLIDNINMG